MDRKGLESLDTLIIHTYGRKTVRRLLPRTGKFETIDLVMYDHAIDKLGVRLSSLQSYIHDRDVEPFCAFLSPDIVYHWSHKFNCLEILNAYNQTRIQHPYPLDLREVNFGKWPLPFGDREVFGLASDDGVQIWFFNPHFVADVPDAKSFGPKERDDAKK